MSKAPAQKPTKPASKPGQKGEYTTDDNQTSPGIASTTPVKK